MKPARRVPAWKKENARKQAIAAKERMRLARIYANTELELADNSVRTTPWPSRLLEGDEQ